jgi:hypothetical protein
VFFFPSVVKRGGYEERDYTQGHFMQKVMKGHGGHDMGVVSLLFEANSSGDMGDGGLLV